MFGIITKRFRTLISSKPELKEVVDWARGLVFDLNTNFKKIDDTFKPIATLQSLLATDRIDHSNDTVEVVGCGGAVTLTSVPTISAGYGGERLTIIGTDDTNTVTLQDESLLTGSNLQLAGGANVTLGKYDTLELIYSVTNGAWSQKGGCTNN